jgi:hypothetical protein
MSKKEITVIVAKLENLLNKELDIGKNYKGNVKKKQKNK